MHYLERCRCGKESSHVERRMTTWKDTYFLYYCDECHQNKAEREYAIAEQLRKQREEEELEAKKQARYEYLKREVELAELEEKAKKYGID